MAGPVPAEMFRADAADEPLPAGWASVRPPSRLMQRETEDPARLSLRDRLRFLHVSMVDTFLDTVGAFRGFAAELVTLETILVTCLTAFLVVAFCSDWLSPWIYAAPSNLNQTLFSAVVVFPLTFALNESFRRRETALSLIAQLKATLLSFLLINRDGKLPLPDGHLERLRRELAAVSRAMCQYLLAPTVSHTRHLLTEIGRSRHEQAALAKRRLLECITLGWFALSSSTRDAAGACDAGRLAATLLAAMGLWEPLHCIKKYRTPQSTRAFGHVALWMHPLMLGPYYAWVVRFIFVSGLLLILTGAAFGQATAAAPGGAGRNVPRLGFAVFLACCTSVSLSALINARYVLEDPFRTSGNWDVVRTASEFASLRRMLDAAAGVEDLSCEC